MFKKFKKSLHTHFQEVLKTRTSPGAIALGFSLGTFFANFPSFGLEFLAIVVFITALKSINKVSFLFAYVVWNPFITYPLSAVSYLIGDFLFGSFTEITIGMPYFQEFLEFTLTYFLGATVLASCLAVICYYIVYFIAFRYQRKHLLD